MTLPSSLSFFATGNRLSIVVAALVVATAVIAASVSDSNTSIELQPSVSISFGTGRIDVSVTLPGPQYYEYYEYYTYYYYYTTTPGVVPVKVIVAIEDLSDPTAPRLARLAELDLQAHGSNNVGSVSFTGLEPGRYRVKVMFWNQLLSVLHSTGGSWKSYASPVIEEGEVG